MTAMQCMVCPYGITALAFLIRSVFTLRNCVITDGSTCMSIRSIEVPFDRSKVSTPRLQRTTLKEQLPGELQLLRGQRLLRRPLLPRDDGVFRVSKAANPRVLFTGISGSNDRQAASTAITCQQEGDLQVFTLVRSIWHNPQNTR